jgi:hypothetical protein
MKKKSLFVGDSELEFVKDLNFESKYNNKEDDKDINIH